jgi:hypothetical protein
VGVLNALFISFGAWHLRVLVVSLVARLIEAAGTDVGVSGHYDCL